MLFSMAHLQDLYPDIELAAPPLAPPLHEPKPIYSTDLKGGDNSADFSKTTRSISSMSGRSKRESYNLSGSTFLVTASDMTLKLPIPSNSDLDPLNWSRRKAAGAILAVAWYFVTASTVVQAPSLILPGIASEFGRQVRTTNLNFIDWADLIFFRDIRP